MKSGNGLCEPPPHELGMATFASHSLAMSNALLSAVEEGNEKISTLPAQLSTLSAQLSTLSAQLTRYFEIQKNS